MAAHGPVVTASAQTPRPDLISKALNMCPGLLTRTEAAAEKGQMPFHVYSDCECLTNSIDYNTWDEASAGYYGPAMPASDAFLIVGAIAASDTIEEAVAVIDANVSETGYSAVSSCYEK